MKTYKHCSIQHQKGLTSCYKNPNPVLRTIFIKNILDFFFAVDLKVLQFLYKYKLSL